MKIAITTIYILNCFFLLMVVLLQAGRGGGLSFAGGGSSQVLGARGTSTFLQKLTVWSAAAFMVLSMVLAHMSSRRSAVEEGTFLDPEDISAVTAPSEEGAAPAAAPVEVPVEVPAAPAEVPAAPAEAPAAPAEAPAAPTGDESGTEE